jgi:hypothetical protein
MRCFAGRKRRRDLKRAEPLTPEVDAVAEPAMSSRTGDVRGVE